MKVLHFLEGDLQWLIVGKGEAIQSVDCIQRLAVMLHGDKTIAAAFARVPVAHHVDPQKSAVWKEKLFHIELACIANIVYKEYMLRVIVHVSMIRGIGRLVVLVHLHVRLTGAHWHV